MTKKNIQCSLAGLEKMAALRAQGRHGFDDITSSRCCELGEDDGTASPEMAWVIGVTGSRIVRGAQRHGPREDDIVMGSGTVSQT
jgi:hypothetical protein